MPPFITLTTDFGLSDPYVASIKGVIYTINPGSKIIDVSHDVRPQAIEQAVFILQYALPYLPPQSIHVMVVDPGVGSSRRALALVSPLGVFIGPDNGLLSAALPDGVRARITGAPASVTLTSGYSAYELTNDSYHRKPVSNTFHGRDIFSPIAAHLSLGVSPADLGPPVTEVVAIPPFLADSCDDGSLSGRVVHADRYGNLITNVRAEQIHSEAVTIQIAGRTIEGLSRTYSEAGALAGIIAGTGFLAIVVPNGSAASELSVDIGHAVTVRAH
jgi:S-adenosylmethionine hydrolase